MIENWTSEKYANSYYIDYMAGKDTGACFSKGWKEMGDKDSEFQE